MTDLFPYERSPEAVRDSHRLLELLRRERWSVGNAEEDAEMAELSRRVEQLTGLEMLELILNNSLLFSRQLVR